MQNNISLSQLKRPNFMRAFLDRFTNTRESAAHKRDDLLNSSVARSPPTSPSPKADFYAEDPKFFAGATRADRKDDSAFAIKSLSFCSSRFQYRNASYEKYPQGSSCLALPLYYTHCGAHYHYSHENQRGSQALDSTHCRILTFSKPH